MKRIKGLDSIRFVCAFIVLIGHFGIPWPQSLSTNASGPLSYIGKTTVLMFNGPAAVIIFFIISGFCIHYPFRNAEKINLYPYYTRRLLRIGIPAIIAVGFYLLFKADLEPPLFGVFWSIICEVIYYLLYPILFAVRKHIKWDYIFAASFLLSICYFLVFKGILRPGHYDYGSFGYMTWLLGLPCWISGCWLSENYHKFKTISPLKVWALRAIVIVLVMALMFIKFHATSPFASYTFTLTLFAPLACLWLGYEIMFFQERNPNALLESAGKWSYSLYIMHPVAYAIYSENGLFQVFPGNNGILILGSLILAYIFYLLAEKPSHRLSIYVSNLFINKAVKPFPSV